MRALALAVGVGAVGACAGLNAAAVGRTDRLRAAPFYRSYAPAASLDEGAAVTTPVGIDETMREELYYSGLESALLPLLDSMNAFLARLDWTGHAGDVALPLPGAPKVFVGSAEAEAAPAAAAEERAEHDKYPPMVIHVERASADWRAQLAPWLRAHDAERVILIRLGLTEYPKADRGFFGKKVVLGTGYEEPIRFLSAEDVPVEVLQVTGMLVAADGTILRAGAEGILSKDSPFWVQIFGARRGIDDEAVRRLLEEERRQDLPGEPLKWQVALRNLVAQLLVLPAEVTS